VCSPGFPPHPLASSQYYLCINNRRVPKYYINSPEGSELKEEKKIKFNIYEKELMRKRS
jgi:hypothetical protein